jgi:hypothetical protein|tara:strand:- start:387 stop:761 length:375 start_codon:yes stop_codon:yes gene_type:complete
MRSTINVVSTIFSLAMLAPMAWGHHSHANYSEGEWLFLEGTVREIYWMNPHSWIYLDVVDSGGQSRAWAIEGVSLTELRRSGWTENSIQAGDELALRCHPLKDGARGCLLGEITLEDPSGKEFD